MRIAAHTQAAILRSRNRRFCRPRHVEIYCYKPQLSPSTSYDGPLTMFQGGNVLRLLGGNPSVARLHKDANPVAEGCQFLL